MFATSSSLFEYIILAYFVDPRSCLCLPRRYLGEGTLALSGLCAYYSSTDNTTSTTQAESWLSLRTYYCLRVPPASCATLRNIRAQFGHNRRAVRSPSGNDPKSHLFSNHISSSLPPWSKLLEKQGDLPGLLLNQRKRSTKRLNPPGNPRRRGRLRLRAAKHLNRLLQLRRCVPKAPFIL